MEGGGWEGNPRRNSPSGVPVFVFRTWLSFPQAQRLVRHNGLQNTGTWGGHTQPHAAKPRCPRLPSPFLLFGENTIFKYFLLLSLPRSLTHFLLLGLPTPQTASPGSNQPDQHVIEIVCLFYLYLLLCHPWQNLGSWRVNLQLA